MEEIPKYFLDFFKRKDGSKSYWGLFTLIIIFLLINYTFNFTDQYKFEKKIENIKSIENLLNDKTLDKNVVVYLNKKKQEIITEIKYNENDLYLIPKEQVNGFLDFRKFPLLHYLSSSWLFIILAIYTLISLFRRNTIERVTFFASRLLTILLFFTFFYILSILYATLLEIIPIISFNKLWINYIVNFISVFIVILSLYFLYQILNFGINYNETIENSNNEHIPKSKVPDIFEHTELGKVIGEKNPLLWAGQIIKYNFKENNKPYNIVLSIVIIFFFFFSIFCFFYTIYNLFQ